MATDGNPTEQCEQAPAEVHAVSPQALYRKNRDAIDSFVQRLIQEVAGHLLAVAVIPGPTSTERQDEDGREQHRAYAIADALHLLVVTENIVPLDMIKVAAVNQTITKIWQTSSALPGSILEHTHRSGVWEKLYNGDFNFARRLRCSVVLHDPEKCLKGMVEAGCVTPIQAEDFTNRTHELISRYREQLDAFVRILRKELPEDVIGLALEGLKYPSPETGCEMQAFVLTEHLPEGKESEDRAQRRDELLNTARTRAGLERVLTWWGKTSEPIYLSDIRRSRFEAVQELARATFLIESKFLLALRACTFHCERLVAKLQQYIVSYAMSGSVVTVGALAARDVDVFIVIDDTDVKKMTRQELKERLRQIAVGMAMEVCKSVAPDLTLNVQMYLLTDYWESLRDANPIIFTLLRDAVPFYDRGLLRPWQHLLKVGSIRPSAEAVEKYLDSADSAFENAKKRIRDVAMEDLFYAGIMAAQAVLMSRGSSPTTPRETVSAVRALHDGADGFPGESADLLERLYEARKALEHETEPQPNGQLIGELYDEVEKTLPDLRNLATDTLKDEREVRTRSLLYDCLAMARRLCGRPHETCQTDDLGLLCTELAEMDRVPSELAETAKEIAAAMSRSADDAKETRDQLDKLYRQALYVRTYLQRASETTTPEDRSGE